jgi:outer membrane lipoprotein-sorting protein
MFEGVRMKKLSLLGLAFALLFGATFVPPATAAAPATPQGAQLVSSIFNKMERNRQSLKSLRASVLVQKVDARFGEEMSRASVQYVPGAGRNANVRLDFSQPREEVLAVKDGQYTYYKKRANMAYKGRSNNAPKGGSLLSFVFSASGAQLRNDFNYEYMGDGELESGGAHVTWIKLVPKGGADFRFAEIWVDDSGMPIQTRITERNGDSTLVRLTGIQRNVRVSPDVFNVSLPSGVKVINS